MDPRRDDVEAFYGGMDRWFDAVVREQQREADALFADAMRMRQQRESYFRTERWECSSDGSYFYSESVTTTGEPPWMMQTAGSSPSLVTNILTVMAFLAAALYAILTFRFNQ